MTEYLICLDAVWEHAPEWDMIRRIAGEPTPSSPSGEWLPYLDLEAGTGVNVLPTHPIGEPVRPGRRMIIHRNDDGRGATDATSLICTTDRLPAGRWRPGPEWERFVAGPAGSILLPHIDPSSTVGIAAIFDVAEALPDPEHAGLIADWYWPIMSMPTDDGDVWIVHDRTSGVSLAGAIDEQAAQAVARLLTRHPIRAYADIFSALMGAPEWDTGPAALHNGDDDMIAAQLEAAGWPADHLAAFGPRARRELLLSASLIEQTGTPWPLVYDRWRADRAE